MPFIVKFNHCHQFHRSNIVDCHCQSDVSGCYHRNTQHSLRSGQRHCKCPRPHLPCCSHHRFRFHFESRPYSQLDKSRDSFSSVHVQLSVPHWHCNSCLGTSVLLGCAF